MISKCKHVNENSCENDQRKKSCEWLKHLIMNEALSKIEKNRKSFKSKIDIMKNDFAMWLIEYWKNM